MEPKKPTKPNQTPRKVENGLVVTRGAGGGGGWSGGPARFHRSSLDREPGCVPPACSRRSPPRRSRGWEAITSLLFCDLLSVSPPLLSYPCTSLPLSRWVCPCPLGLYPHRVPLPHLRPPSAGKVRSAGRGCRKEHPAQLPSWSVPPSQAGDRLQSDQGLPVSLLLVQKSGHMCSASASLSSPSAPFWLVRVGLGQAFRIPEQYGLRLGCGLGEGGGVADLLWLRSQDPRRQWDQPSSPESSRTRMSYPQLPEDLTRLAV